MSVEYTRRKIIKIIYIFTKNLEMFEKFSFDYNNIWIGLDEIKENPDLLEFLDDDMKQLLNNKEIDYVLVQFDK